MKRTKLLLGPQQKRTLYILSGLLWLSGTVWLCLPDAHPARPLWMKIHGAAAMAFLIVFGTLLVQHVPAGWQEDRQRPSGGSLLTLCGILIVSGWGLYYVGNEPLRHAASLLHSALGILFPAVIFLHVRMGSTKKSIKD